MLLFYVLLIDSVHPLLILAAAERNRAMQKDSGKEASDKLMELIKKLPVQETVSVKELTELMKAHLGISIESSVHYDWKSAA